MTLVFTGDQVNPPGDAAITYGISAWNGVFDLRARDIVDKYEVDWGDGAVEISTLSTLGHTYSPASYTIIVYSDGVYRPYWNGVYADVQRINSVVIGPAANLGATLENAWKYATNMTSFVCSFDVTSGVTNFTDAWREARLITSFPLIDMSSGTVFDGAWYNCDGLTSFPSIDMPSGTNFSAAWTGCGGLTSFPLIDMSSGTNFSQTWRESGLTSFPSIDMPSGTNFELTWYQCNDLTSFPSIDMSSGTNFRSAWFYCNSLTSFPANMFDTTGTLASNAFDMAWSYCALTAQSIENILVSLDTNGQSSKRLGIDGGTNAGKTTWSAAAVTAYDNLIAKSWIISFNP